MYVTASLTSVSHIFATGLSRFKCHMITSLQNPRVKDAIHLRNARHRHSQGRILIDGVRELTRAIQSGVRMIEIFICESLLIGEESHSLLKNSRNMRRRNSARFRSGV